jgi:hypothetical protein
MLVLAPAACCLAGIALHEALAVLFRGVHAAAAEEAGAKPAPEEGPAAGGGGHKGSHRKPAKAKVGGLPGL